MFFDVYESKRYGAEDIIASERDTDESRWERTGPKTKAVSEGFCPTSTKKLNIDVI